MKGKSGHYNGPETCRTAFVIPDHIAILLLLLLLFTTSVINPEKGTGELFYPHNEYSDIL